MQHLVAALVVALVATPGPGAQPPALTYYRHSLVPNKDAIMMGAPGPGYDRWAAPYAYAPYLLGPAQTGRAGRWEFRNGFNGTLLYETSNWDGTGTAVFAPANGQSLLRPLAVQEFKTPKAP